MNPYPNQYGPPAAPPPTRLTGTQILLIMFIGIPTLFVGGCVACLVGVSLVTPKRDPQKTEIQNPNPQDRVQGPPGVKYELPKNVKLLDNYELDGNIWTFVVISPRPSQAELIKIARALRKKNSQVRYEIFDSAEKSTQYIQYRKNYAKVIDRDGEMKFPDECDDPSYCYGLVKRGKMASPYPEKWVEKHAFAMIYPVGTPDGPRWKLTDDYTDIIADLE